MACGCYYRRMTADDFLTRFLQRGSLARILRVFALNAEVSFTAREAGKRASVTQKLALKEIGALHRLGLIKRGKGNKASGTLWLWDASHPHARAVASFVREVSPTQYANILKTLRTSGRLSAVVLSGVFFDDPSRPADILVAGDGINTKSLERAITALEHVVGREIRYAAFSTAELRYRATIQDRLIRDTVDYPHVVLLDRSSVFIVPKV